MDVVNTTSTVWTKLYGYRPNFIGMDQTTVLYNGMIKTIHVLTKLYGYG